MYLQKTLDWVNANTNSKELLMHDVELISSFLLLWGLFEGKHFRNENLNPVTLTKLGRNVSDKVPEDVIESAFGHFCKRYRVGSEALERFGRLKLATSTRNRASLVEEKTQFDFVDSILSSPTATRSDKIVCLLNIVLRYRNNIFHGVKEVYRINVYRKEIDVINVFMSNLVSNLE